LLYFVGGSLDFIAVEKNITTGIAWLSTANILANAASCTYAGCLQDLFCKRYIALVGSLCICIGCALVVSGHSYAQLIAGMVHRPFIYCLTISLLTIWKAWLWVAWALPLAN